MKNVMISGSTGAIGMALINKLIQEEVYMTVLCHTGSKRNELIPRSKFVQIVECNLNELSTICNELESNYDVFYHFGWECTSGEGRNDVRAQHKNIGYTIDAVELAHHLGCKRFVGAGSQAEYGLVDGMLTSYTPTFPVTGYGIAKLCAGNMSRIRSEQLGIEHIWTRILSVYGPYDGEQTLVSSLIQKIMNGEKVSCTKGEQIWDYIYSKDIANAFFLLGENGIPGKTYVLGSGVGRPLSEYISIIRNSVSKEVEIGFGEIPYASKQVMHLCADISELVNDTGFRAKYSFEEGIMETVDFWKKG